MNAKRLKAARRVARAIVAGDDAKAEAIKDDIGAQPELKQVRRAVRLALVPVVAAMPRPPPLPPRKSRKSTVAVRVAMLAAATALAFALAALL